MVKNIAEVFNMIRMKIFKIDPGKFDMAYIDQNSREDQSEKGIAK